MLPPRLKNFGGQCKERNEDAHKARNLIKVLLMSIKIKIQARRIEAANRIVHSQGENFHRKNAHRTKARKRFPFQFFEKLSTFDWRFAAIRPNRNMPAPSNRKSSRHCHRRKYSEENRPINYNYKLNTTIELLNIILKNRQKQNSGNSLLCQASLFGQSTLLTKIRQQIS